MKQMEGLYELRTPFVGLLVPRRVTGHVLRRLLLVMMRPLEDVLEELELRDGP